MKILLPLALVFALPALTQAQTSPRLAPGSSTSSGAKTYTLADLDQLPKPLTRVPPKYPDSFRQLGVPGETLCRMNVSESGDVTSVDILRSSHPELEAAAQAALLQWKFNPGQKAGQPVACQFEQLINFPAGAKLAPRPTATGPRPTLTGTTGFETPDSFFKHGDDGQVTFLAHVSEKGRVTSVELISASHDELIEPAKATLMKWKYDPVIIDDKKAPSQIEQTLKFSGPRTSKERQIALNAQGKIYTQAELDKLPSVERRVDPVLPYDFRASGKSGLIEAELTVSKIGKVILVTIKKSTNRSLNKAVEDALYLWRFTPATKDGQPVATRMELPVNFGTPK